MIVALDYSPVNINTERNDTIVLLLLEKRFRDFPLVKKLLNGNCIPHAQFTSINALLNHFSP
jgi:hypothetical protein